MRITEENNFPAAQKSIEEASEKSDAPIKGEDISEEAVELPGYKRIFR